MFSFRRKPKTLENSQIYIRLDAVIRTLKDKKPVIKGHSASAIDILIAQLEEEIDKVAR